MRLRRYLLCALALPGLALPLVFASHATAGPRVYEIHGDWTARFPGADREIETGENHGAGILNGTFVVLEEEFITELPNGALVIRHIDLITSKSRTHTDPVTGKKVPDTVKDDLTVTVVPDGDKNPAIFIGKFFDGTGIFAGAGGYYHGEGAKVPTPRGGDPNATYIAGTIGGELRLAKGSAN